MKIIKYKKVNGSKYKILFDNDFEMTLYEEVILKYNLLIKKNIDISDIHLINKDNLFFEVYYCALTSLRHKAKSIYETRIFLEKKQYPAEIIESVLKKLTDQGYLDDTLYTKSFVNYYILSSNNGPYKIKKMLLDKKVDMNIIENEILFFTSDMQLERIRKIIEKKIKLNNTLGGNVLRQKLFNDLVMLGYESSFVNSILNEFSFENDFNISKNEYLKLRDKYGKKLSGLALKRKIKEKLYSKGLMFDEEWEYED